MRKSLYSLMLGAFFVLIFSKAGYAQQIDDIGHSIANSIEYSPALIAALSYLAGLVIAITAIFKTVDHVNNPSQTPLNIPVIRYLLAGALFGLPIIAEAAWVTINGSGSMQSFDPMDSSAGVIMGWFSTIGGFAGALLSLNTDINSIFMEVVKSIDEMPALVSAVGYLLGLIIIVSALYKTRDHVEDPQRVPLKDAVIRYLTAGALFALPAVFEAMYETIASTGLGVGGTAISALNVFAFLYSSEDLSSFAPACTSVFTGMFTGGGSSVGNVICRAMVGALYFPIFLNAVAYLLGLVIGVWGIMKIRDHVLDPQRVALSEGVMRMIAGGSFFALPYVVTVLKSTFLPVGLIAFGTAKTNTGFNSTITSSTCNATNSLDEAMGCFMKDILGPAHVALNFFSFVAGMIFIMIGISRLLKSSQEGARGPGGIGTFGTFVVGGMLLSATTILRAFSASLFNHTRTYTMASISQSAGMTSAEQQAVHNLISAVLQFMIVLGMVSFVRGMFIMRDVAEGKGNASVMAGVTHMIGGALAVNLGPLLNAIQKTLGIHSFGVTFS